MKSEIFCCCRFVIVEATFIKCNFFQFRNSAIVISVSKTNKQYGIVKLEVNGSFHEDTICMIYDT